MELMEQGACHCKMATKGFFVVYGDSYLCQTIIGYPCGFFSQFFMSYPSHTFITLGPNSVDSVIFCGYVYME